MVFPVWVAGVGKDPVQAPARRPLALAQQRPELHELVQVAVEGGRHWLRAQSEQQHAVLLQDLGPPGARQLQAHVCGRARARQRSVREGRGHGQGRLEQHARTIQAQPQAELVSRACEGGHQVQPHTAASGPEGALGQRLQRLEVWRGRVGQEFQHVHIQNQVGARSHCYKIHGPGNGTLIPGLRGDDSFRRSSTVGLSPQNHPDHLAVALVVVCIGWVCATRL
mmetsp:Transcript_83467/g.236581  ORF Transcript_83467/g.236581 Transcript_83467/m.236581 type:complete len:224 (+) Transcript_83467:536-1207(+)